VFRFQAGRDRIVDFDPARDRLQIEAEAVAGRGRLAELRDAFSARDGAAILELETGRLRLDDLDAWPDLRGAVDIL
jgi:hypothetical protein